MAQVHGFTVSISWLQAPQYPRPHYRNSSQARRRRRRIHLALRHTARDSSFTYFRRPSCS
jgi:hypothetical protein